jgi:hypothetical protein
MVRRARDLGTHDQKRGRTLANGARVRAEFFKAKLDFEGEGVGKMKKANVQIGGTYQAKVSNKRVMVKILKENPYGGWVARNLSTGRDVRIRTAGRLTPFV